MISQIHRLSNTPDQSGLDLFVTNLEKFHNNPEVQMHCIGIMYNVISANERKHCNYYDDLLQRALPLIIQAMMKHPNDAELQEQGCYFMWSLARHSNFFLLQILENKGMVAVAEAYRLHKDAGVNVLTGAKHFFAKCFNIEVP
jgi:hypothetical protein